jgi:hypothetical protein
VRSKNTWDLRAPRTSFCVGQARGKSICIDSGTAASPKSLCHLARAASFDVMMVSSLGSPSTSLAGLPRHGRRDPLEGFQLNDRWDDEEATGLLRAALAEIDSLIDELSPARAEALLDEFERDVGSAFFRQDLPGVKATCEGYQRSFRTLAKEVK